QRERRQDRHRRAQLVEAHRLAGEGEVQAGAEEQRQEQQQRRQRERIRPHGGGGRRDDRRRLVQAAARFAIAFAKAMVLPVPPRSGVSESPASRVASMASRRRAALSCMPRWSSIWPTPSSSAQGLATPLPAMSGAEPWTASKIAASVPMLAPGARPRPPTRPAHRSEMMSPNRLVV